MVVMMMLEILWIGVWWGQQVVVDSHDVEDGGDGGDDDVGNIVDGSVMGTAGCCW